MDGCFFLCRNVSIAARFNQEPDKAFFVLRASIRESDRMRVKKIISGGQTGADRGGWDAAMYRSIPIGGWVPKGRKAEDKVIPDIYENLKESPSANYLMRTEANIKDSDATLIFSYGPPTGGSKRTVAFAEKHRKPFLPVDLDQPKENMIGKIVAWLQGISAEDGRLNVAGSRGSKEPAIQAKVKDWMTDVIREVNAEEPFSAVAEKN